MESNWRLNVPWYFGSDSGIRLCARFRAPLGQFLLVHRIGANPKYAEYWYFPLLSGWPVYFGDVVLPQDAGEFPWHFDVLPD